MSHVIPVLKVEAQCRQKWLHTPRSQWRISPSLSTGGWFQEGKKETNAPTYDTHTVDQHSLWLAHLNHAFNSTSAFLHDIRMAIIHCRRVSGPKKGIDYCIKNMDSLVLWLCREERGKGWILNHTYNLFIAGRWQLWLFYGVIVQFAVQLCG